MYFWGQGNGDLCLLSQAVLVSRGEKGQKVLKPPGHKAGSWGRGALPISCQEAQALGADFVIKDDELQVLTAAPALVTAWPPLLDHPPLSCWAGHGGLHWPQLLQLDGGVAEEGQAVHVPWPGGVGCVGEVALGPGVACRLGRPHVTCDDHIRGLASKGLEWMLIEQNF